MLSQGVLRAIPNLEYPFIVKVDASRSGIGALLLQETGDGERCVVEFASKCFNETEKRYPTIEQEAYAVVFAILRWQHYLLGKHFELETDHKPLVWLQSKKDCRGKLGRWALRLEEFDFSIRHVAGKDNADADLLSRAFASSVPGVSAITLEAQMADPKLLKAKERNPELFVEKEGLLYFEEEPGKLRLCVTEGEKEALWKSLHDRLGHRGPEKVIHDLRSRFYWPGLRSDVKSFAKGCWSCSLCKDFLPGPTRAPMVTGNYSALDPMDKVSIDVMGPLEGAKDGSRYLLVFQDCFSKWV